MKIEDQVVNLDLAKQLKELGFEQESLFWWANMKSFWDGSFNWHIIQNPFNYSREKLTDYVSAYTVAEVLAILPASVWDKNKESIGCLEISKTDSGFVVGYANLDEMIIDENLANAGSKLLIYLKQNNLI